MEFPSCPKFSSSARALLAIISAGLLVSCGGRGGAGGGLSSVFSGSKFSVEEFSSTLRSGLVASPADTGKAAKIPSVREALYAAYSEASFRPLWIGEDGSHASADSLLADLEGLKWDGLAADHHGFSALKSTLSTLNAADVQAVVRADTACTAAYLRASRSLLLGALDTRRADSLWYNPNDSVWSAASLLARGSGYPSLDSFRPAVPMYASLRTEYKRIAALAANGELKSLKLTVGSASAPDSAVARTITLELGAEAAAGGPDSLSGTARSIAAYQARYGLKVTGTADSATRRYLARSPDSLLRTIAANLERLRWLPRTLGERYIFVNVPQMELFYREANRTEVNMRVVVGRPSRQTPSLSANMANVVFNPPWGVPPTILKNDVVPGIARRGGAYLARKGLRAYDRRGREVNASSITASNYRSFSFRQPPGAHNALGEIKFNLPNPWDIYLHDTPHREDFPKRYRALSSGCVRVHKPKELAEFILTKIESRSEFDPVLIDSLISTRVTQAENLKKKLPVHIVYLTMGDDGGGQGLRYLEDVYKKDRKLLALLPG